MELCSDSTSDVLIFTKDTPYCNTPSVVRKCRFSLPSTNGLDFSRVSRPSDIVASRV